MNPTKEEIEKAFEEAWKARVKSDGLGPSALHKELHADGYKAGAKAEREQLIAGVEDVCDKVIESWENAYDPIGGLGAQDVIDLIQKLKQETK